MGGLSLITSSTIQGANDAGEPVSLATTNEGHLEVALYDPILPFGSLHVENMTPIFQSDPVYGINQQQTQTTVSGTGSATTSDSLYVVSTGATALSQGVIQSRKRLRYRPGQGVIARFTAKFTAPVAYSYQLAGLGHAEDGIYVGYADIAGAVSQLGILYVNRGVRETRTLTVTVGATSASNCTITLNSVAFTVALTAASNIQRTVYEISQATYAGWDAYPIGTTVVFVKKSAGTASGTYSFGAGTTGASASIAQTKAGVASTDTFIPQSSWNGDKLNGTGDSGLTIDPTKLNIFQISFGYLGTDAIVFKVKLCPANGNNPTWITFHTIRLPNTLTTSSFSNPSLPFTLAAYSVGSTTNLVVNSASFSGFIEGNKFLHGGRFSYFNSLTTVGAANFQALFTIMNTRYYKDRANQAVINLLSVTGALKHTSPCIFYLIKNGTLAGNPNFQTLTNDSCSVWDTAATTVSYTDGYQLLWTGHLGDTGELDHHFGNGSYNAEELTLQPGEWVTLAARATTGTPAYVTGSINTREDQ